MTDDNSNLVDMDLDSFSKTFFGKDEPVATETPEPTEDEEQNEEVAETEDDALATETDEDATEEEDASEDEEQDEEDEEPKKPVKKSAQERINEVVAKQRQAERERDALMKRVAELEAATKKPEVTQTEDPKPLREQLSAEAPNPDAKDEKGEPLYKLGEFDPQYIRDLTRFTIEQETKAAKEAAEKEAQQKMVEAAQEELRNSWLQKVEETEKELPDLREKLGEMEAAFAGIDPGYGEYLAATIMSADNGPQIMYYLSQNIGEAQKIVAAGPHAATFAIAKLDAKFQKQTQEEKRNTKKTSEAPKPPETRTRGAGGRFAVPADTNDLAAFEREYFQKK